MSERQNNAGSSCRDLKTAVKGLKRVTYGLEKKTPDAAVAKSKEVAVAAAVKGKRGYGSYSNRKSKHQHQEKKQKANSNSYSSLKKPKVSSVVTVIELAKVKAIVIKVGRAITQLKQW